MKIILNDEYKSLKPFISEELADFTIITGKNGSGKTQLLELLDKKLNNSDSSVLGINLRIEPVISKIQFGGLSKSSTIEVNETIWKEILLGNVNLYNSLTENAKKLLEYIIDNSLNLDQNNLSANFLSDEIEYKKLLLKVNVEKGLPQQSIENMSSYIQGNVFSNLPVFNKSFLALLTEISSKTKKNISEFRDIDFYSTPLSEQIIDNNSLFESRIELIFYNYAKRRDKNQREYFNKKEYGDENDSISDNDFVINHRPPWELINQILSKHGINFYFKDIDKRFDPSLNLDFQLKKKGLEIPIKFDDLSSGEKVIIGLILKLFTSDYYNKNLNFPELLILDEPDAFLHPEMSKLLIDVLQETFVEKYGIKVIISTHSPSTIALCPENNIFQLKNGLDSSLKQISKDSALQILTSFIPTLSIDYQSHRQIFVESPTDVNYYQSIYNKHQQYEPMAHKLYFISNSYGKSNCAEVYKIVKELRKSGNTTSFGFVDWDLTNISEDFIFVHGENLRYSIENYLFDPLYVIVLLMDMNNAHNICESIGIDRSYNQFLIGQESEERLQEIVKFFFLEFEKKFPAYKFDTGLKEIEYLNGKKVKIPEWYLRSQGHDLVGKLKMVFPALGKFNDLGAQSELTLILTKCYPLIPIDSINLIESIGVSK